MFDKLLVEEERFQYLKSLLSEDEWKYLLFSKSEWEDMGYETEEEIIDEHFEIKLKYKGYDLLHQKLFVLVEYIYHLPEYGTRLYKTLLFETFAEYYNFVGGAIYSNATYYGYNFSLNDIKAFDINDNLINIDAFEKKRFKDERTIADVMRMKDWHWNCTEEMKKDIEFACKHFFECKSFEDFQEKYNGGVKSYNLAAAYHIVNHPEETFNRLESFKTLLDDNLKNYILFHYRDGQMYDKYCYDHGFDWMPKKHLAITPDTPYKIDVVGIGFDDKLNLFYKEMMISFDTIIQYRFKQVFLTIEELAANCNNDLSNGDFFDCRYDIDWTKYKTENANLPYGKIHTTVYLGKLDEKYEVLISYHSDNGEISSTRKTFYTCRDVIHYFGLELDDPNTEKLLNKLRNGERVVYDIN